MFLSFGTTHVLTCVYTYMCVGTSVGRSQVWFWNGATCFSLLIVVASWISRFPRHA